MHILGISSYYHDSAACLLRDGVLVAAAQEERFTRQKHDPRFPSHAVRYCLDEAGIGLDEVRYAVFYEKPFVKFERLIETYVSFAPRGIRSFLAAMPVWSKEKLFLRKLLRRELMACSEDIADEDFPELLFGEHHESHAASAFFPSPFDRAAVLCMDGVGEWTTTSAWVGEGATLTPLWEIPFPHSLGLLYSAFTYYTGFKVNSGEYKVMGLAPFGEPRYVDRIREHLIDVKPDGTFRLNMTYFNYCTGLTMTGRRFDELFGGPRREPESPLAQRHLDLARSVQEVTEDVTTRLSRTLIEETGERYLCMAGGVALNCVGNGRIRREVPMEGLWIQPAAGDAGGAVGAALSAWHQHEGRTRATHGPGDRMQGSFLGPAYSDREIEDALNDVHAVYRQLPDDELYRTVARALDAGDVVGWFQGRMEFGPRALGARSILADPRNEAMQSIINRKIKFRESFRPFAPAVLAGEVSEHFDLAEESPYMLLVASVREDRLRPRVPSQVTDPTDLLQRIREVGSELPAVTHVDGSARIQTVHRETNPRFHALVEAFRQRTGCGVLVNTSFNVRGEPIVCTPEDAYRCFMGTDMDVLVLGNAVLYKSDQNPEHADATWTEQFALD